jgi:hypothetical protein
VRSSIADESRLAEIAELAEAVAEEYCPSGRVEPEAILKKNAITLSFGRYEDAFDGMLEYDGDSFHVYANLERLRATDSGRARFTLGHELGHFYIDDHRRALQTEGLSRHPSYSDHQSDNPLEIEADHFACHLLMPTARFVKAAKGRLAGLETILALKDLFGTSITSTAIRFTKLDLAPCTLVKWQKTGFAWKWFSPSTYAAGYRRTIEDPSTVPRDSPTGRALAGEAPPASGVFQAGTLASSWFRGVLPGTHRDLVFIEQAISLGEFGVLTFLFPEQRRLSF